MIAGTTGVLLALLLAGGCSGPAEPRLEEWVEGAYQARGVSGYEITGQRDGATTRAVATFTLASGERLRLELELVYNPTPALGSGVWRLDGAQYGEGGVRAESLKFLGGQSAGPSLGGRFRLEEENGRPRFRAVLPLRPLDKEKQSGAAGWAQ